MAGQTLVLPSLPDQDGEQDMKGIPFRFRRGLRRDQITDPQALEVDRLATEIKRLAKTARARGISPAALDGAIASNERAGEALRELGEAGYGPAIVLMTAAVRSLTGE